MQKRNHQRKKLRGKLRKCKIARRHNCHLIVVLCNPFGFTIERAKYINLLGYPEIPRGAPQGSQVPMVCRIAPYDTGTSDGTSNSPSDRTSDGGPDARADARADGRVSA